MLVHCFFVWLSCVRAIWYSCTLANAPLATASECLAALVLCKHCKPGSLLPDLLSVWMCAAIIKRCEVRTFHQKAITALISEQMNFAVHAAIDA